MRFDDRDNFVYLLKRGIHVFHEDKNGNNAVHFAVLLEKVNYLSFMIEGTFDSYIASRVEVDIEDITEDIIQKKAIEIYMLLKTGEFPWIKESLVALEKSNIKEGNTTLHMAIDLGHA